MNLFQRENLLSKNIEEAIFDFSALEAQTFDESNPYLLAVYYCLCG